ncbi:pentatricopeptide repeat-containing protein [Sesbania bispinosa]|nr:pentatricopeptide repeat-containing protein [Sesbania bispinosa]
MRLRGRPIRQYCDRNTCCGPQFRTMIISTLTKNTSRRNRLASLQCLPLMRVSSTLQTTPFRYFVILKIKSLSQHEVVQPPPSQHQTPPPPYAPSTQPRPAAPSGLCASTISRPLRPLQIHDQPPSAPSARFAIHPLLCSFFNFNPILL